MLPEAEFDLGGGERLRLHSNRLVHDGPGTLEIFPYTHLASVRVAFERDARKLNWAIGVGLAALVLALLASPMQGWFAGLAKVVAAGSHRESLEAVLIATFNALGALARLFPTIAATLAMIAVALAALFVLGRTTLTLAFAATERAFTKFGRNRPLIEFAEILGDRLAQHRK